jgi:hypothetical protein
MILAPSDVREKALRLGLERKTARTCGEEILW